MHQSQPYLSKEQITEAIQQQTFPAKGIKDSVEQIRQQTDTDFLSHRRGMRTARNITLTIDQLLLALIELADLDTENLCIAATGGYGRALMAPYSDIDLLLLHEPGYKPNAQQFITYLWDTGLKVGFINRATNEFPQEHTARTAFLDARYLWGNIEIFKQTKQHFYQQFDVKQFTQAKLTERRHRQEKYDYTSGLVEPNLKDGIGALRDIDFIQWVSDQQGIVISEEDEAWLKQAEKLFWTMRVSLHLLHHNAGNRLSFSLQQEMATLLQYRCTIQQQEAARLMKHYHLLARQVQRIADRLLVQESPSYPTNNQQVFNVICYAEKGANILKNMHQDDQLEQFIPDMKRLKGLMQFDMYHKYTVDVHTLRALEILHRLKEKSLPIPYPFVYELCAKSEHWKTLCLAILCHDLAKGLGGDHSLKGMELVARYGKKFQLSKNETALAIWLIEHHLLLTFNAFRRDINDPDIVDSFVKTVGSQKRLNALFAITIADIIATNPQLLNDWKKTLLEQLYNAASKNLQNQTANVVHPIIKQYPLAEKLPNEWFLAFDEAQQAQQMTWLTQEKPGVYTQINTASNSADITIINQDRTGLFADITASMALAGLNIVEARLFTIVNGAAVALDHFTVQDNHGNVPHADHLERFKTQILSVLKKQDFITLPDKAVVKETKTPILQTGVKFDIHGSRRYLIIEVTALDRPGLLAECAAILRDLNLKVFRARINTQAATALGQQVIDTFYVTDQDDTKITKKRYLTQIKKALIQV